MGVPSPARAANVGQARPEGYRHSARDATIARTYGADDKPLIPVFSRNEEGVDGKMASFCTGTWKRSNDEMALYESRAKGRAVDWFQR